MEAGPAFARRETRQELIMTPWEGHPVGWPCLYGAVCWSCHFPGSVSSSSQTGYSLRSFPALSINESKMLTRQRYRGIYGPIKLDSKPAFSILQHRACYTGVWITTQILRFNELSFCMGNFVRHGNGLLETRSHLHRKDILSLLL